jgi:hypothetical protein
MAHTTQDRDRSHALLEEALAERDRCQDRYESTIGTNCEMSAYMRLRRAGERVQSLTPVPLLEE